MIKRIVDVACASILLVLSAPLTLLVAIAIRIDLGRPVVFRQQRSGHGGEPFTLLKFRTMRLPPCGRDFDPASDADRLTPLGRRLRQSSLDEIPQLVNVLRGEMSLVGPRPLPTAYLARYSARQRRRLEVRPGITGWAQIHGRNTIDWNTRFELDVWYVDHRTARLDLRILASTVARVLTREGIGASDHATMSEFNGDA